MAAKATRTLVRTPAKPLPGKKPSVRRKPAAKATVEEPCIIVGVGGSAGAFQSAMALFKDFPSKTCMALVLVHHLDPKHESKLAELVGRGTRIPVRDITNGQRVRPGNVYVLPSKFDVVIDEKQTLRLSRRPPGGDGPHLPVDLFFQSLAKVEGANAIGIVLSGTGSDGTAGLRAIRAAGGSTFAEAEKTAKYFGMPGSAIAAGCVDFTLPPEGIARELGRLAEHFEGGAPALKAAPGKEGKAKDGAEHEHFQGIFHLLKKHTSVDFSRYKDSTLRRRICRRMALQQIERLDQYTRFLTSNPAELDALFNDLLINVTGFFRDPAAFEALKRKIFPKILKNKDPGDEIRVWVPGCATGEEVYSLAICLMEALGRSVRHPRVRLFGTDLSDIAIAKARAGVYPDTIARKVSAARLKRFFVKVSTGYQVERHIREMCTFARQNMFQDPPFSRLDLISCRNVLIYLGPALQKKCMPIFHYALRPGGFLLLGTSETVGTFNDLFSAADRRHKIYESKPVTQRLDVAFDTKVALSRTSASDREPGHKSREGGSASELRQQADKLSLAHYSPPGVVVDSRLQVVQFRGRTAPYLEHAQGAASLNVLQMVRPSLAVDLRTAMHNAFANDSPTWKECVVSRNGEARQVRIDIMPFRVPGWDERWLLILFGERDAAQETALPGGKTKKQLASGRKGEALRLQRELDGTKESLQAIIEEQEATNEELKSANEEVESSNEELQSTNEELETAKEELQSTNEELTTLNEELGNRNLELAGVNNDLNNLLSSINLPIVIVDNAMTVRRVTPLAEKLLNLIPSDIGRRVTDVKPNIEMPNLEEMIADVIESLGSRELEVRDSSGHWYLLRIRPYRTAEHKIDGAIITFIDIDETKRGAARLQIARYAEAVVETVQQPILLLKNDLKVEKANRAFCEMFGISEDAAQKAYVYDLPGARWNDRALRRLLEKILPQDNRFEDYKLECDLPSIGKCDLLLNARRLGDGGEDKLIFLALKEPARQQPQAAAAQDEAGGGKGPPP